MSEAITLGRVLAGYRGRAMPWREALDLFSEVSSNRGLQHGSSDVRAAARLLIEMLTGGFPEGQAHEHNVDALRRRLAEQAPGLPAGVAAVIAMAFAPDPRLRFNTTADFVRALHEGAVGFLPSASRPGGSPAATLARQTNETAPTAPRAVIDHPRLIALLGVPAFLTLGLTAVWWTAHDRAQSQSTPALSREPYIPRSTPLPPTAPLRTEPLRTPTLEASPPVPRPKVSLPPVPSGLETSTGRTEAETKPPAAGEETTIVIDPMQTPLKQLDRIRQDVRAGIDLLDQRLTRGDTEGVRDQLEGLMDLTRPDSPELAEERRELHRVQDRWLTILRLQQAWEDRLSTIRELIAEGKYPEALSMSTSLSREVGVPEELSEQARELAQQARQELRRIFEDSQVGTTENNLQKPPD